MQTKVSFNDLLGDVERLVIAADRDEGASPEFLEAAALRDVQT